MEINIGLEKGVDWKLWTCELEEDTVNSSV